MKTQLELYENKQIIKGSQTCDDFFFALGKNFKIEFILDDVVQVESRTFSLATQSVSSSGSSGSGSGSSGSGGGSSGSGSGSSGSSSSNSKVSTVGTAAQIVTTVVSCLVGRVLLLEIFTTAVLILN